MESRNQVGSSSFTDDLFGAKGSSPNSTSSGVFSSIFAAPSAVGAKNYSTSKFNGNDQKLPHGSMSLDKRVNGDMPKGKEGDCNFSYSKEINAIFQERLEPSPLSSSLYYGGKEDDMHTNYKKDGGVDLSGNNSAGALRGNWWEGSFYY